MPERPPRHSSSSSNRSRSLEIIDQSVQSNDLPIKSHSKSLDKLLTNDKICTNHEKIIESYPSHQQDSILNVSYIKHEKLGISDDFTLNLNINLDNLANNNKPTKANKIIETSHGLEKHYDSLCPMPIPRQKTKSNKSELINTEQLNSTMSCNSVNSSSSHCDKSTCSLNENILNINSNNDIENLTNKNICKINFDENESALSCNSNFENITELMTNDKQQKNQNFINKCIKKMKSLINK